MDKVLQRTKKVPPLITHSNAWRIISAVKTKKGRGDNDRHLLIYSQALLRYTNALEENIFQNNLEAP